MKLINTLRSIRSNQFNSDFFKTISLTKVNIDQKVIIYSYNQLLQETAVATFDDIANRIYDFDLYPHNWPINCYSDLQVNSTVNYATYCICGQEQTGAKYDLPF